MHLLKRARQTVQLSIGAVLGYFVLCAFFWGPGDIDIGSMMNAVVPGKIETNSKAAEETDARQPLEFKVTPSLGAVHSAPANSTFVVRVTLSTSESVVDDATTAEVWTDLGHGDTDSGRTWHSVEMHACSDASTTVVVRREQDRTRSRPRCFEARIKLPQIQTAFEYTARLVQLGSTEPFDVDADDIEKATVKVGAPSKVIQWLNKGNDAKNADVVVVDSNDSLPKSLKDLFNFHTSITFSAIDIPADSQILFAGSINAAKLTSNFLQLKVPNATTLVLERRKQHWLQPAHGKNGWPHTAISMKKEVSFALWSIQSDASSDITTPPLFAVLIPTPPHVLAVTTNGYFGIAPTHSAYLWPHEFKSNPVRAFVAVSRDPVAAVQFILKHIKANIPKSSVASLSKVVRHSLEDSANQTQSDESKNVVSNKVVPNNPVAAPASNPQSSVRFYDRLGWCTWNSLYQNVSEKDIVLGLNSFKDHKMPIDWLLIDDGWQNTDADKFTSFGLNAKKFPSGYSLIKKLKKDYKLSLIGVWHSLVGYWGGIQPESEISEKYPLRQLTRKAGYSEWYQHTLVVDPAAYPTYYSDLHKQLTDAGVDFFKIDDQSVFEASNNINSPSEVMSIYQDTLVRESKTRPVIWCMAHNMEVLYGTLLMRFGESVPSGQAPQRTMRTSDDFFPDVPDSHTWHVQSNALNTLLIGNLDPWTLVDWDMFQSDHAYAQFHAISRALSNGPVYLSDVIGNHSLSVVAPLLSGDNRLIHVTGVPNTAPMPLPKSLLVNLTNGDGLLFVQAYAAGSHGIVLGVFNCAKIGTGKVSDSVILGRDVVRHGVDGWGSGKLAVAFYANLAGGADEVDLLDDVPGAEILISLGEREADVVTVVPLWKSAMSGVLVGCLGLQGKYYGVAGVRGIEFEDVKEGGIRVRLDAAFAGVYSFVTVQKGEKVGKVVNVECSEGLKKYVL